MPSVLLKNKYVNNAGQLRDVGQSWWFILQVICTHLETSVHSVYINLAALLSTGIASLRPFVVLE